MLRSPSIPLLLSTTLAITALTSNSAAAESGGSETGQCNIHLLIPENYERAPIEIEDANVSLEGTGPLNPFIIQINGELATPNPIISGCFDIHLGLEARRPGENELIEMVIEPL